MSLHTANGRNNLVVIFGKHAAIAALNNPQRIISRVFLYQERKDDYLELIPKVHKQQLEICDQKRIDKICGKEAVHQGIAVLTEKLRQKDLKQLLSNTKERSLVVVLDRVTDPFNVGSILRSAKAFGADFLISQERHSASETSIVAKTASGALETIPICSATNLAASIDMLQKNDYMCYGLDGSAKDRITDIEFYQKTAIILGAEGAGIRAALKSKCDQLIKIPMAKGPNFDSINVTNACAIACFKFYAQLG